MSIYTRTGDQGTTSLFGGKRVLKCEELVDVYGSIDELNSHIGLIASLIEHVDVQEFLNNIQKDLFAVGSSLAGYKQDLRDLPKRVKQMEARIDLLEAKLPDIRNFILPGGVPLASHLHVARAVARRVERQAVSLNQKEPVEPRILTYLNRLSDLLFMLARFINYESGVREVSWNGRKPVTEKIDK